MRIRVLGSVEMYDGSTWQAIGAAKCRAVLGALVAQAPDVVRTDQLIDAVWGDAPPRTATTQIHGYVLRLRRSLKDDDATLLATTSTGYRLLATDSDTDAGAFEAHVVAGVASLRADDAQTASDQLLQALALWRGEPFGDIPTTGPTRSAAERLTELRRSAIENRIDAEIRCGRSELVIGDLRDQIAEHPLREQLWRHLMVALYCSDRQAEALSEYQRLRRLLIDELGTEPGAGIRAAHQQILDGSLVPPPPLPPPTTKPSLTPVTATASATAAGPGAFPVLQLPAGVPDFTGRAEVIGPLVDALRTEGDSPTIIVIHGSPGTGKSTLALHLARAVPERFPDAQLYVDLAATGQPRSSEELLAEILRAIGMVGALLPDGVDARSALVRSQLAERRTILVLDDASSAEQVRPLLPPNGLSAVLVSTRVTLTDLPGARHVELGSLQPEESEQLLARIIGADRVAREPDEAAAIVTSCGHLPLTIRIAGGKLLGRPTWPLHVLRRRLDDESRRLSELKLGNLDVRASLDLSLRSLPADAVRAFDLLGLVGAQDVPSWVLAPLLDREDADDVLDVLVDANLLQLMSPDGAGQPRYRLHDLLRVRAVERCQGYDGTELRAAVSRLLGGWLGLVDRARQQRPASLFAPPPGPATRWPLPDHVADYLLADPLSWFDAESRALLGAIELAAQWQLGDHCWELAGGLAPYYDDHARYDDWTRSHDTALAATADNQLGQAVVLRGIAQVQVYRDELDDARRTTDRSLALFSALDHGLGQGLGNAALATVNMHTGHTDEAMLHMRRALRHAVAAQDGTLEAVVRCGTARILMAQGRLAEARPWLDQALRLSIEMGDRHREAIVLQVLARLQHRSGELTSAVAGLEQASQILTGLDDGRCLADSLFYLGQVHADLDERDRAVATFVQAAEIFQRHRISSSEASCREAIATLTARP